jgi:hypothetical protein
MASRINSYYNPYNGLSPVVDTNEEWIQAHNDQINALDDGDLVSFEIANENQDELEEIPKLKKKKAAKGLPPSSSSDKRARAQDLAVEKQKTDKQSRELRKELAKFGTQDFDAAGITPRVLTTMLDEKVRSILKGSNFTMYQDKPKDPKDIFTFAKPGQRITINESDYKHLKPLQKTVVKRAVEDYNEAFGNIDVSPLSKTELAQAHRLLGVFVKGFVDNLEVAAK